MQNEQKEIKKILYIKKNYKTMVLSRYKISIFESKGYYANIEKTDLNV